MLDYEKILNWQFAPVVQTYSKKDCMLYALGLGYGNNPTDENELQYVYEKNLKTFPTMAVVLGHPGSWLSNPESGIDMTKVLHGAQSLEVIKALPVEGTIVAHTQVLDVIDKGIKKGAVLVTERKLYDQTTNEHYCTQQAIILARGNGGFDGPVTKVPAPHELPERKPDTVIEIETSPQAALLFRLSGDYNPLHVDLELADNLGFAAPILHGLASYGVAARAVLQGSEISDCNQLKRFSLRFTNPVYPGETISTEIWKDNDVVSFRSKVKERDVMALNNGRAELFT
jgi:acyl dehydratase